MARRAGFLSLEARCLAMLADIDLRGGRMRDAQKLLDSVPADDQSRAIDRELRARIHGLRAQAYRQTGDLQMAATEDATARSILEDLAGGLDDAHRASFWNRPSISATRQ